MTYSYNYGSGGDSQYEDQDTNDSSSDSNNQQLNDLNYQIVDDVTVSTIGSGVSTVSNPIFDNIDIDEETLNELLEEAAWLPGDILRDVIFCHGGQIKLDESQPWSPENINVDSIHQFPECPGLEIWYRSGWDYKNYTVAPENGYQTQNSLKVRLVKLGMPDGIDNEPMNPHRILNLPEKVVKFITAEPKKFIWVHPFLDKKEDAVDAMDRVGTTIHKSMDKWQSGKLTNGPSNCDLYLRAGFHSMPGGNNAFADQPKGSGMVYEDNESDRKWVFVLGNSRGRDQMGYPNQPTEGLDYGVVGMSGFFRSHYNVSAETKSNVGIKFAYTMNRIDTSSGLLEANVKKLQEAMEALEDMTLIELISEITGDRPDWRPPSETPEAEGVGSFNLDELEDPTGGGTGEYNDHDKAIIQNAIDKCNAIQKSISNNFSEFGFNLKEIIKRGSFRKLSARKITDDPQTHTALAVLYDMTNFYINKQLGVEKEYDHKVIVSVDNISQKIKNGEDLSWREVINNLLTGYIIRNREATRVLNQDFDFEQIGEYLLDRNTDNDQLNLINFIRDVTKEKRASKFRYVNGALAVVLETGFVYTSDQYNKGHFGWCDACMDAGGQISNYFKYSECEYRTYDSNGQEIITVLDRHEHDGSVNFDVYSLYDGPAPEPATFDARNRVATEAEPGVDILVTNYYDNRPDFTAQEWRGLYCVPSGSTAAMPDWSMYDKLPTNICHTYGPFSDDEMSIYYNFIVPKCEHKGPSDFGITWWFASTKDGPWVAGDSQGPTVEGYNCDKRNATGYKSYKPKKRYMRASFWQWFGVNNTKKGSKVKREYYPPGYNYMGIDYEGKLNEGKYIDVLVTPKIKGDPYDGYDGTEIKGATYYSDVQTAAVLDTKPYGWSIGQLPDLNDEYWIKPISHESAGKGQQYVGQPGYYRIYGIPPEDNIYEELRSRPAPIKQKLWVSEYPEGTDISNDGDDSWRREWTERTFVKGTGYENYRTFQLANRDAQILLGAIAPDRIDQEDWGNRGEPWTITEKIDRAKWIHGPGYWGELHINRERPNFHDDVWQTPLNHFNRYLPGEDFDGLFGQRPNNVRVEEGERLKVSAYSGDVNTGELDTRTKYDYDIYFVLETNHGLDVDNFPEKDLPDDHVNFIYGGTILKNDYNGFVVTPPSSHMIFHARNTNRVKADWKNNGEPVSISTSDHVNQAPEVSIEHMGGARGNRDLRKGPAYWAFGDFGSVTDVRKGFRGYPDFNSAYYNFPLNDYNETYNSIRVRKGRKYHITPGDNMIYTHRIIWGTDDRCIQPNYYEDPSFGNKEIGSDPNRKFYHYEDDNSLLLRPKHSGASKTIEVEAQGDYLFFGAFRYDQTDDDKGNPLVDRPINEYWSRFGEGIDVEITEVPDVTGCGFWASEEVYSSNNPKEPNWSRYDKPMMHLTQEMKEILRLDGQTQSELEGQLYESDQTKKQYERVFDINSDDIIDVKNPPPANQRILYAFKKTARTPNVDIVFRFIKREGLSQNDAQEFQMEEFVWRSGLNDEQVVTIFCQSEYIQYKVYAAGKSEEQWSKKGEPLYLELYREVKKDANDMSQYWIDWENDATYPNKYSLVTTDQLKNNHWVNPLNGAVPTDEGTAVQWQPGKRYKIWTSADPTLEKPNPNYMHVFLLGQAPRDLNVPGNKDFRMMGVCGNQDVPVEDRWAWHQRNNRSFNGEDNAIYFTFPEIIDYNWSVVVSGAWHTGARRVSEGGTGLTGWNPRGENLRVYWKEEPLEELQGPAYWAGYDQEGHLPNPGFQPGAHVTDYYAYPNIERGEDPTHSAGGQNDYYYGDTFVLGEKNDEPNIRKGRRYRITKLQNDVYNNNIYKPDDYKLHLPHEMRMWSSNKIKQLKPDASNFRDWVAGRYVNRQLSHFDFTAENDTIVFGAFDFDASERGPDSWSKSGEPTNHKFEALTEMPYSGPAYYSSGKDTFPSVADPHFYKGLNTHSVKAETYYTIEKNTDFNSSGGTYQIWYIKDDNKNNWAQMQQWAEDESDNTKSWPPIPLQGTHPEDLLRWLIVDNSYHIPDKVRDMFYEKGPVITTDTQSDGMTFKTPKGVTRIFYGWYGKQAIGKFNRDGEPVRFKFKEQEKWKTEGPLYWGGEQEAVDPPEFGNTHFESPLRYIKVKAGRRYQVKPKSATALAHFQEIQIYEFDPTQNPDPLNPLTNRVDLQFKKIANFQDTQQEINIDVSKDGLILSATYIKAIHETPLVTDWSPKGEPSPLTFREVDSITGPAYWGDTGHTWDQPGAPGKQYLPEFTDSKWIKPLNTLSINGDAHLDDFYVELTQNIDFALSVFVVEERKHLSPNDNNDRFYFHYQGTFAKRSAKGSTVPIEPHEDVHPKYIIFGVGNFDADSGRSFEDWSPRGEEVPVRIKKKEWQRGPSFPGNKNLVSGKEFDLSETRWRYSAAQPPKNGGKIIGGSTYEFKYASWMESGVPSYNNNTKSKDLRYQVVWCKSVGDGPNNPFGDKRPTKTDFKYNSRVLDPNSKVDKKFTLTAPIGYDYIFFVVCDKSNKNTPTSGINPKTWSPDGHLSPWKYKRVHKDLHLDDIPFLKEILMAIAALLAALLGFLLYFAAMAPFETLLEMVDEGPGNKYPIRRKKIEITEDNKRTYGDPFNPEYITNDEEFYTGLSNDPIYFNFVADHAVRAWARIMRVRHNGYLFHLTNAKCVKSTGDNTLKKEFEVMNLTATHGFNYTQLDGGNVRKALRKYVPWDGDTGFRNVELDDPYKTSTTSYRSYAIDTSIDENRQLTGFDIRKKWFQPSLTYSPQMGKQGFWKSYAGAQYKLASNYDSGRNVTSYPTTFGSANNIDNIFSVRGAGLTTDVMYSSNSSNHCYGWEILNGTEKDPFGFKIPNGEFIPGIEFDMLFYDYNSKTENAGNWQIVQMHLSFDVPDLLEPDTILKSVAVKLTPDSSTNYKFRNSFDNTSSNHQMNQLNKNNNLIHMRLMGDQKIPAGVHFKGISACIWVGEDNVKTGRTFVISNLAPIHQYDNPPHPDE